MIGGDGMRGETEMMGLLLGVAREDERIRAVYLNGSRANPNAPRDSYQDYDVVFVVTETAPFLADKSWVLRFGRPLIVQEPDWNDNWAGYSGETPDFSKRYAWLMLFDDGNRIDLSIEVREEAIQGACGDGLTVVLLDKDGLLPEIPAPTDAGYHISKPSEGHYLACCNDFWWCLNNVAKGIARDELSYAKYMLEVVVRGELHTMMDWYIGTLAGFGLSTGKHGKYYRKYLPEDVYQRYCRTYAGSDYEEIWAAVDAMCGLFHTLALAVAGAFGYEYRQDEEEGMRVYLGKVRDGAYDD